MKKKTTKEKIIVLSLTPKEHILIITALQVIEAGYSAWLGFAKQKKFVVDLINKIAP
jgi:hypothetical protein